MAVPAQTALVVGQFDHLEPIPHAIALIGPETSTSTRMINLIKEIAKEMDVPENDAIKIAECESKFNPNSINNNPKTQDFSVGIFQINLYGRLKETRPSVEWLLVPENNIRYAFEMYQKDGWKPWLNCAKAKLHDK